VLLLLDFWPLNRARLSLNEWRNWLKLLLEKIPYFLVTAGASLTTYHAQAGGSHGETAIATLELVPLDVRLGNLPLAIMSYVGKFFWPVQLVVYYPPPKILLIPMVAAATLTLLAITSFAWWQRKKRPYLLVGWFWFLGMLVPVSGLIQVGSACMADRYTYLPLVGIFIMVAFTTDEVAGRFAVARKIIPVVVIIILLACVGLTVKQIGFWKNSETLFRHDLAVVGDNEIALADLGVTLEIAGRYDEALVIYQRAEAINPTRYQTHANLGNVLARQGHPAEALTQYAEALRLRPDLASVHYAAGMELVHLGQLDEALRAFLTAERLAAKSALPHLEAGKILFELGRVQEGEQEFRAVVRLDPRNYQSLAVIAHYLAANDDSAARDPANALEIALRADALAGHTQPMVLDILGMAFAANGDFANATACAQKALALAAPLQATEAIRQRLALYQQNQPWRENFRMTNSPAIH
jgi:tetratricopeptide (TPR) repeat protein